MNRNFIWVLCLFSAVAIAAAQTPDVAVANRNPELISQLTKQLNITPKQAAGGAGAIFGLAKSRLEPTDFSKIAGTVPGMDALLKAAPTAKGGSPFGSFGSMVPSGAAGLASLAGSFKSLGLSPGMAPKFVPVLENYIKSKGGSGLASLFAGALR